MASESWIVIPRWNDFQHPDTTRSGVMPWLKNFTRLLSDDAYLDLTFPQRGLLHSIWLEYARSRGQLRMSNGSTHVSLSRRLGQTVRVSQLEALNHAGFIEFSASRPASTVASKGASNLASREEKREEKKRQEEEPFLPSNGSLEAARKPEGRQEPEEAWKEPEPIDPFAEMPFHALTTADDDIPF